MATSLLPIPLLTDIETEWAVLPPPPGRGDEGWQESWRHLFECYGPAMVAYVGALIRRVPDVPADAAPDIVAEYVTACMEKGWLSRLAAEIRSFRAYLKTQLYRFTMDWLDRHFAARRSPRREADAAGPDKAAPAADADAALDRAFLDVVLERALAQLARRNEDHAEIIRDLLRGEGEGAPDLAARLGRPERQLAVLRHRARLAFAGLFATELKRTTIDQVAYAELLQTLERHLP